MAGYSGTPLWKKLGLKDGMEATAVAAPPDYAGLLRGGPEVRWGPLRRGVDFVHLFATTRIVLQAGIAEALPLIDRDGAIWASWPKKASSVPSDVTEDVVRDIALPLGLVDVKVCAVDATWSGLKLVIRRERR